MGLFFKSKEEKEAIRKQKEIDENNRRINNGLDDTPYLGSNKKQINSNKMRIENEQEATREDIADGLTELMRMANASFENENTTDRIRKLINKVRTVDLGMNAGTTKTIKAFMMKQIKLAKNNCNSNNRAAVDAMASCLDTMLYEIGSESSKKYYADPEYVNNRLDAFEQEARMKELSTKERLAREHIKEQALELKADPDYMTANEWRQVQLDFANNLKAIEVGRQEAQRRLNLAKQHMSEREIQLANQSVISDQERLRSHENIMRQKEMREDASADLDQASEEMDSNNSHVSTSAMGVQDLGISNQKVDQDELDNFLANL